MKPATVCQAVEGPTKCQFAFHVESQHVEPLDHVDCNPRLSSFDQLLQEKVNVTTDMRLLVTQSLLAGRKGKKFAEARMVALVGNQDTLEAVRWRSGSIRVLEKLLASRKVSGDVPSRMTGCKAELIGSKADSRSILSMNPDHFLVERTIEDVPVVMERCGAR